MIALTSEQDKAQLRKHAFELLKQNKFEGLVTLIEVLKETDFKLNSAFKESFLKEAAEYGHLEIVKYLVKHGADIHTQNDYALRYATEKGYLDIVKYLVENGADIHANNDFSLRSAADNGHLEIAKYLVEQGADIHALQDFSLRWAATNGHFEIVKYLVEHGADVHAQDDFCLVWPAAKGNLKIVKYLVEHGINIQDYALRRAAEHGHAEVVEYLQEVLKNDSTHQRTR